METSNFLKDLQCIKLKPFNSIAPKGAFHKNYTTNISIRYTYPNVPERYGILLKANNLVVVDIDDPKEKLVSDFPETFTVSTRRGFHLYYWNYYKKPIKYKFKWGEIKTSGHVVGLGVKHRSGFYTIFNAIPVQPIYNFDFLTSNFISPVESVKRGANAIENFPFPPSSHLLSKIFIKDKRKEIERILHSKKMNHNKRIWMVGFLYSTVGLTEEEILNLIVKENKWEDYNLNTSKTQIHSICKNTIGGIAYNPELERGYKNRIEKGGKMVKFNELKRFGKIQNGSKWYEIVHVEGAKDTGDETWQYYSLESGQLVQTTEGKDAFGIANKRFTLPSNDKALDQIITSMKEIHTPSTTK